MYMFDVFEEMKAIDLVLENKSLMPYYDDSEVFRTSNKFLVRLTKSEDDLKRWDHIREAVRIMNREGFFKTKMRAKRVGRKPLGRHWNRSTKSFRSQDWAGNIVGGIHNATAFDVYIVKAI